MIAGLFLLIVLAGVFSAIFVYTEVNAKQTVDTYLNNPYTADDLPGFNNCITFAIIDDDIVLHKSFDPYYDISGKIVQSAIDVEKGKFATYDYHFYVGSKVYSENYTLYVLYNRTFIHSILSSVAIVVSVFFVLFLILIALTSYYFSDRLIAPLANSVNIQKDLIANASHELKTPLTIIDTNLTVLRTEPEKTIDDSTKWLDSIKTQTTRMQGLICDMLELNKIEQLSTEIKETVNFSEIASGASLFFEATCFEKGISLKVDIKDNIYLYGNKNALERLVIILLDNAMKYAENEKKIVLRLTQDKRTKLSVFNTGTPLSDESKDRIFERFYRVDNSRHNPENNSFGLGLSIAEATTESHGGTIKCNSKPNGNEFVAIFKNYQKPATIKSDKR